MMPPSLSLIRRAKREAIAAGLLWPVVFVVTLLIYALSGSLEAQAPPKETLDLETLALAAAFYLPSVVMMRSVSAINAHYEAHWGTFGKVARWFALFGLLVVPVAYAALLLGSPQDMEPSLMGQVGELSGIVGTYSLGLAFILFGVAALRTGTPSAGFGLVLIGVGLFQVLILLVSVLRVLAYSAGWVAVGWALPSELRQVVP